MPYNEDNPGRFFSLGRYIVCTLSVVRIAFLTNGFYMQLTGVIWGVNVTAIYGSIPTTNKSVVGIVDTGTACKSLPWFFFIYPPQNPFVSMKVLAHLRAVQIPTTRPTTITTPSIRSTRVGTSNKTRIAMAVSKTQSIANCAKGCGSALSELASTSYLSQDDKTAYLSAYADSRCRV
jgi:hypothetical protein